MYGITDIATASCSCRILYAALLRVALSVAQLVAQNVSGIVFGAESGRRRKWHKKAACQLATTS